MTKLTQAAALFDKLAEQYQQKYMDVSLYHEALDQFCESITSENPEILELACGPGNVTQYLLGKRPDFKIMGTDLAPNMIELARKNNPQARFEVMDCREISKLSGRYDAIVCSFCLPYLTREETAALISDASKILNPGGILYLSTMEDDYEKSRPVSSSTGDMVDMYFYTGSMLENMLRDRGFEPLSLRRQPFPTQDGTSVTDLIVMACL